MLPRVWRLHSRSRLRPSPTRAARRSGPLRAALSAELGLVLGGVSWGRLRGLSQQLLPHVAQNGRIVVPIREHVGLQRDDARDLVHALGANDVDETLLLLLRQGQVFQTGCDSATDHGALISIRIVLHRRRAPIHLVTQRVWEKEAAMKRRSWKIRGVLHLRERRDEAPPVHLLVGVVVRKASGSHDAVVRVSCQILLPSKVVPPIRRQTPHVRPDLPRHLEGCLTGHQVAVHDPLLLPAARGQPLL
mmetsp:Transcript_10759/g.27791  ORF Transcript_10759/g.27791 Transcript_10759/m.27791 type:complete len:247 (-) Transcript_10759:288-1028(-)